MCFYDDDVLIAVKVYPAVNIFRNVYLISVYVLGILLDSEDNNIFKISVRWVPMSVTCLVFMWSLIDVRVTAMDLVILLQSTLVM